MTANDPRPFADLTTDERVEWLRELGEWTAERGGPPEPIDGHEGDPAMLRGTR